MSEADLIRGVLREDITAIRSAIAEGVDVNSTDPVGRTALHHAAISGLDHIVQLLIDSGADLNLGDREGWTALHYAAQDHHMAVAERLLGAGAEVDPQDRHGNTPLWRAVFSSEGRPQMIRMLVRASANKTRKNRHGVSPLDLAKKIANYDLVAFLESPGSRADD